MVSREVRRSLALLSRKERRTYWAAVGLQMATSLLDLAGVLLFGMVGVIAASAAQGFAIPDSIQVVLSWFGPADVSATTASLALAGIAALLLVLKTLASLWILRWVTKFLTAASTRVSAQMCADFYALPIVNVNQFASQWSAFALGNAVTGAIVETLTNAMVIWVELTLLVVLGGALLLLNPLIALFAVGFFGLISIVMNQILKGWAHSTGKVVAETSWESQCDRPGRDHDLSRDHRGGSSTALHRPVPHAPAGRLRGLRRPAVHRPAAPLRHGDRPHCRRLPAGLRDARGGHRGKRPRLPGAVPNRRDPRHALHAPAERFPDQPPVTGAPRRLRLHDGGPHPGALGVRRVAGHAPGGACRCAWHGVCPSMPELVLEVVVQDLTVDYPGSDAPAISGITFTLPPGGALAVVGPSGGGKSTLADAILGVVEPSAGWVRIGGLSPGQVVRGYPGLVAYVPQSVALVSGTVRDNVALGRTRDQIDDDRVWAALKRAHLADYLADAREGLDTEVGERGVQLSGGQRQRLGIARALYTDPRLLVMDEATSALDAEIEDLVTQTIEELGSEVTTITIAHRLATVRRADTVIYLDRGRLLAQGTFEEVRSAVPRFDHQANLLGL